MSSKKAREPRKPLNQSFIDFVHGTLPEESPEVAANSDADAIQTEFDPAIATQLHEVLRQELQAAIANLQSRLTQLESTPIEDQEPELGEIKRELTEVLQRLQTFESQTQTQYSELCDRIADLEQLQAQLPDPASATPPRIALEELQPLKDIATDMTESAFQTLMGRFDRLEQYLLEEWASTSALMSQIQAELGTLNQDVAALRETIQNSVATPMVRSMPEPSEPIRLLANQDNSNNAEIPVDLNSTPELSIPAPQLPDSAPSDPLIHRLSTLLDAF